MPTMKRLDRYLVREMIIPFLIGQGAVVLMLTGTVLYNNADIFLTAHIPVLGILKVAAYFIPYLVSLTMPVAMAIAASLLVSRLARDTEITVMRAAGISLRRIFLPLTMLGLALSIVDFYFGEQVVPWSNRKYEQTITELSRATNIFTPQSQQVIQSKDRKLTAYIEGLQLQPNSNKALLTNVMILRRDNGNSAPTVMLADTADYENGIWTLHDARIHTYGRRGLDDKFVIAKSMRIDFRLAEQTFMGIPMQLPLYSAAATRTWADLKETLGMQQEMVRKQRAAGNMTAKVDPNTLLEYHFKLSVPFSCLVFAIVCPPLALRFAKAGNFMGVLLSICLVFVYWNMLLAAKIIGTRFPELLPPIAAAWGQNVLFVMIGGWFLWRGE
ncbi:MAG: LptF/LptG family permease [Chthonomonadales bacterium]